MPALTATMLIVCGATCPSTSEANASDSGRVSGSQRAVVLANGGAALPYTVADPAQMAIIGIARAEAERLVGRKLLLKVTSLRRKDGWAFLFSTMIDENGDPLDLTGTILEDAARAGVASRVFCTLLKQDAGTWRIVESGLGVTDVAWTGWDGKYGAPPEIFEFDADD
ncbi:hypothetical protein [Shinella sp.]|uniref:hypothetical protein n=1 Tax=Shinella sp. TaxID=1870904 RepID=UPI0039E6C92B